MDKTWRFSKRAAALAVSLTLSAAAQAGNVRGNLDPPAQFGMPAYNGFANFDVPTSCLTAGAGWHSAGNASGDCGVISMESATIYLYPGGDGTLPGSPQGNGADNILTWSTAFSNVANILGILLDADGKVLGIDSDLTDAAVQSNPANYPGRDFYLQFFTSCLDDGEPVTSPICGNFDPIFLSFSAASILDVDPGANPQAILTDSDGKASATTAITFVVPEPGTVSLLLGALGVGWMARRRKPQASS